MLSEVDLPPVAGVERPWIGTEARVALGHRALSTDERRGGDEWTLGGRSRGSQGLS